MGQNNEVKLPETMPENEVARGENAFQILGDWSKAAREAGWTKEQRDAVLAKATDGDYDHLQDTIEEFSS